MSNTEAMQRALTDVVSRGDFTVPPYPAVALRLQRLLAMSPQQMISFREALKPNERPRLMAGMTPEQMEAWNKDFHAKFAAAPETN